MKLDNWMFFQEWRRVIFHPNGERLTFRDSSWYADERIARSLLNDEYPEPTPMGYRFVLQTRWTSEVRTVQPEVTA